MATNEDDLSQYLASLNLDEAPAWNDADDVARISQGAAARFFGDVGDYLEPSGQLRLTGAGVTGNSAPLEKVGTIMTATQHIVNSLGAAIQGVRAARGQFSAEVLHRTALELTASPMPGSVILQFGPSEDHRSEDYTDGKVPIAEEPDPLVDQAFRQLFGLLQEAQASTPDSEAFVALISDLGPRVASSLRSWTDSLASAYVDAEMTWSDAQAGRTSLTIERATSQWIGAIVSGRMLDAVPGELVGTVRTVSDVSRWAVDVDDGSRTSVKIDRLAPSEITNVRVGDRVRLQVLIQERSIPGHPSTFVYSAVSVAAEENG